MYRNASRNQTIRLARPSQNRGGYPIGGRARSLAGKADHRRRSLHPPELSRLGLEDQIFVIAFLRSHGSIKEMEQTFGVSYPTIKARLNRIAGRLEFVETNPAPSRTEVLERLNSGEITAAEAIEALEALS